MQVCRIRERTKSEQSKSTERIPNHANVSVPYQIKSEIGAVYIYTMDSQSYRTYLWNSFANVTTKPPKHVISMDHRLYIKRGRTETKYRKLNHTYRFIHIYVYGERERESSSMVAWWVALYAQQRWRCKKPTKRREGESTFGDVYDINGRSQNPMSTLVVASMGVGMSRWRLMFVRFRATTNNWIVYIRENPVNKVKNHGQ